jgi:UDP-glucose 4-epimerase
MESTWADLAHFDFDVVYHLAAQTSGEKSQFNPRLDMDANSLGTLLATKFAVENNVKHFIYMSTSAVYGPACVDVVDELTPPQPNSVYGINKLAGEYFVKQASHNHGLDYTVLRLTNCYGPGEDVHIMNKGMVSIFCSMAWKKEPIHSRGSKDRFRNFIHVVDVINALNLVRCNDMAIGEMFLLSTGKKITVERLISAVCEGFDLPKEYPIIYEGSTSGDTFGFHADISKIKRVLGWRPSITIEDGIRGYAKYLSEIPVDADLSLYHPLRSTCG